MSIRFCAILFLLVCGSAALTAAQSETASLTYIETRELLLKMDPDLQGDTTKFKKLFEEADTRSTDLVCALYDSDIQVSQNAQNLISYLAEPQLLSALEQMYRHPSTQHRTFRLHKIDPVSETKYFNGKVDHLARLVIEDRFRDRQEVFGSLIAFNKKYKTVFIQIVIGEIFSEGWHVVLRNENGRWRLVSNSLGWQH